MSTDEDIGLGSTTLPDREGSPMATPEGKEELDLPGQALHARLVSKMFAKPYEPVRMGRFSVQERIGAGAMGVVHAAYDDTLDRKVAIKLIQDERAQSPAARERLLREARAMARLSHSNVVHVYEAGEHEGQLFIAMEFVAGQTLRGWLEDEGPRSWREVVEMFIAIGQGLHAAHQAGVVHRDFKPENVLLDDSGRPKVADFGLAGLEHGSTLTDEPIVDQSGGGVALTHTGVVMGTPAYMSPEQHEGEPADARSDQFSYCIALWEALCGARPYTGKNVPALALNVVEGKRGPLASSVPGWLGKVLERGLATKPGDRWPTMADLIARLERGRRRGRIGLAVGLGGAAALGVAVTSWVQHQAAVDRCIDAGAHLADVWTPERRSNLRAGIEQVDVGFAATTAEKVDAVLTRYADDWIAGYRDACEATEVRGEQSAELMQGRIRCLEGRKRSFAALAKVLEAPDEAVLNKATAAANKLPLVSRCGDAAFVSAAVAPPEDPTLAASVDELHEQLAMASALRDAGKYEQARPIVDPAVARADELGYQPAVVAARNRAAEIELRLGQFDAAIAHAQEAYVHSDAGTREEAMMNHHVMGMALDAQGKYDAALVEFRKALAIGKASLGPDHLLVANAHNNSGMVLYAQAKYDAALVELRAALEIRAQALPSNHPDVGQSHNNVGAILSSQGKLEEALVEYRKGLAIRIASLGPDHPDVASSHENLGSAISASGDYEGGLTEFRKALAIRIQVGSSDHPEVAYVRDNMGLSYLGQGKYDEALVEHRAALEIWLKTVGPDHPEVAFSRDNIGNALRSQGNVEEALVELRSALEIRTKALGPEHPDVAFSHNNIGAALYSLGRQDEALAEHRQALAAWTQALGPDHPDVARSHNHIGRVLHALGKHNKALVELRKAQTIRLAALGPEHPSTATSHDNIGMALLALGKHEDALVELQAAVAIRTKVLGTDHPQLVWPIAGVAMTLAALGRTEEAAKQVIRVVEIAAAKPARADVAALAELMRAIVGGTGTRADVDAVRGAGEALRAHEAWDFAQLADAWLAKPRPTRR